MTQQELDEYLYKKFTNNHSICNHKYPLNVWAIAIDHTLIKEYLKETGKDLFSKSKDYAQWLREHRQRLFPTCGYFMKRDKKVPYGYHTLGEMYLFKENMTWWKLGEGEQYKLLLKLNKEILEEIEDEI